MKVTVFDFSTILERTERRVRDDLLGAGPKTVDELRSIAGRLRVKYQNQLERRIERALQKQDTGDKSSAIQGQPPPMKEMFEKAGGFFARIKPPQFSNMSGKFSSENAAPVPEPAPTIVDIPPEPLPTKSTVTTANLIETEGDWVGANLDDFAADAITNFSIGDDDEDLL